MRTSNRRISSDRIDEPPCIVRGASLSAGSIQLVTDCSEPSLPMATSSQERGPLASLTSTSMSLPQSRSRVVTWAQTPVSASVLAIWLDGGSATTAVPEGESWPTTSASAGPPVARTTEAARANRRRRRARLRVATSPSSRSSSRGPGAAKGWTLRGVDCRYSINCRVAGRYSLTNAVH